MPRCEVRHRPQGRPDLRRTQRGEVTAIPGDGTLRKQDDIGRAVRGAPDGPFDFPEILRDRRAERHLHRSHSPADGRGQNGFSAHDQSDGVAQTASGWARFFKGNSTWLRESPAAKTA